jgi:hypothetical protein
MEYQNKRMCITAAITGRHVCRAFSLDKIDKTPDLLSGRMGWMYGVGCPCTRRKNQFDQTDVIIWGEIDRISHSVVRMERLSCRVVPDVVLYRLSCYQLCHLTVGAAMMNDGDDDGDDIHDGFCLFARLCAFRSTRSN